MSGRLDGPSPEEVMEQERLREMAERYCDTCQDPEGSCDCTCCNDREEEDDGQ